MNRQFFSRSKLLYCTLTFAAAALSCASSVDADVWNVPGNAPTIQVAINLSSAGDEIEVEPSTYFEKIDLLGKTLVIRSTGGSAVTIIDALGQFDPVIKIISGEGPETRIEGFTIRNGEATDAAPNERGGGVYCNGPSPTFVDCVFTQNEAVIGGAFYNNGGVIDFIDCVFNQNETTGTGGAVYQNGGTVNYTDCTFSNNTAGSHGGAIRHVSASGTYTRCTFEDNSSDANGGAMDMAGGGTSSLTFRDCLLENNVANGQGGAVQLATPTNQTVNWINCIFRANEALFSNGGAVNVIGRGVFLNCTFYGNLTNGGLGGGGVYVQSGATAIARSCIAWGNSFGNFSGVTATYCTVENGYAGTGNSGSDPQFVNAAGGDFRLQESSPCIDAGDATQLPLTVATDFDLLPRVINAASAEGVSGVPALGYFVDMGAFEFQPAGGPDPCPADTNGDGMVNVTDLLNLLAAWGSCF